MWAATCSLLRSTTSSDLICRSVKQEAPRKRGFLFLGVVRNGAGAVEHRIAAMACWEGFCRASFDKSPSPSLIALDSSFRHASCIRQQKTPLSRGFLLLRQRGAINRPASAARRCHRRRWCSPSPSSRWQSAAGSAGRRPWGRCRTGLGRRTAARRPLHQSGCG